MPVRPRDGSEWASPVITAGLLLSPTAQRSAHELPMVERQDTDGCLVYGGQQMILTGQNFTAESKVMFTEKTTGQSAVRAPCEGGHLFLLAVGGQIPSCGAFLTHSGEILLSPAILMSTQSTVA